MPVTTGRKAIRFKSIDLMQQALLRDDQYQHRHLVLNYMLEKCAPCTRKEISENTGVPVNAMSKVAYMLIEEGVLRETEKITCPCTGRNSRGIAINPSFDGPY